MEWRLSVLLGGNTINGLWKFALFTDTIVLDAIVRSVPTTTSTVTTTPSKTTIVRSNYIYAYFPLNTQRFTFKGNYISFSIVTSIKNILFLVKTKNDVHVALSVDAKGSNVNEIVIGGWGNSKSTIRRGKQGSSISGGLTSVSYLRIIQLYLLKP